MPDVGLLLTFIFSVVAIIISVLAYSEAKRLSDIAENELKLHEDESKRENVRFLLRSN